MGSALAGAKAGSVAALYFAGSTTLFNVLLLLTFKSDVLTYLSQNFPSTCPSVATSGISGTADTCFTEILEGDIPITDFVRVGVIALIFAVIIGVYFDYLPGKKYVVRTLAGSAIMVISMLFLGLNGVETDQLQVILMVAFQCGSSLPYALVMARLFRRFSREVQFSAPDGGGKIFVDKRNVTGKTRTFGLNSSHSIEVAGSERSFRGWLVSGGVTVKEPKQQKTAMRVAGDGLLRIAP